MEGRNMTDRQKQLYEAAVTGDVRSLNQLVNEDRLILARVSLTSFDETPLHIAAMQGHLDFVRALLHHKPDLASEVNSQGSSPLHLASTNGYTEIAKLLVTANPDMCSVRDEDGRTPLHLAVMKGRLEVIEELVRARSEVVRYKGDRGETLLHLAVKHNRVESLKLLSQLDREADVNARDDDGNTVLHIATSLKQLETVKYLIKGNRVKVEAGNRNGFTALDLIENMPRDLKVMEIRECLLNAGALSSRKGPAGRKHDIIESSGISPIMDAPTEGKVANQKQEEEEEDVSFEKNRGYLMITAAVIACMSYYLSINPPGGTWDRDSAMNDRYSFRAGRSILSTVDNGRYNVIFTYNTVSFIASTTTMFLLLIGFPLKQRIVKFMTMASLLVAIVSLAISYVSTVGDVLSWEDPSTPTFGALLIVLLVWLVIIGIVFLIQVVRFIVRLVRGHQKKRNQRLSMYAKGKQGPDQA